MCELFAINSREPFVANDYLREFFSHSTRHPDGWGIASRVEPDGTGRISHAQGSYARESHARESHTQGSDVQGSHAQESGGKRPDAWGSGTQGSYARGPDASEAGGGHASEAGHGVAGAAATSVELHREPVAAYASELLPRLLDEPIRSRHLIAHIRRSTGGGKLVENCHPFLASDISGTEWAMAHNGIVFNEQLTYGYEGVEQGKTDSERAMLFFMDCLDEATLRAGGRLDFAGRFDALASAIMQFSNLNRLNVILSDGTYTYVHTNTDIVTLCYRSVPETGTTVVATTPLGAPDEVALWRPVPQYRLVAFRGDEIVRMSKPHAYVFAEAILALRKAYGDSWQQVLS